MEDIVQRLRKTPPVAFGVFDKDPLRCEAADEIERLRTLLRDAQLPTAADVRGIMAQDGQMTEGTE